MTTTRTTIILNPGAGRLPPRAALREADGWLHDHGWEVSWQETGRPGEASELAARAADDGVSMVFACGGDGTVSEIANGLKGSETALAVIPAGTINLWAGEIAVPHSPVEAVRAGVTGVRRRVDLGRAGRRHFLLMAGLGLDAEITRRLSLRAKRRIGPLGYLLAAVPRCSPTAAVRSPYGWTASACNHACSCFSLEIPATTPGWSR
jgi:diacylglycerol kinase family enzyme